MLQKNGSSPVSVIVTSKESPGARVPESHSPSTAVDVCDVVPLFVNVRVLPAERSVVDGSNAKFTIDTCVPEEPPWLVVLSDELLEQAETKRTNTSTSGAIRFAIARVYAHRALVVTVGIATACAQPSASTSPNLVLISLGSTNSTHGGMSEKSARALSWRSL